MTGQSTNQLIPFLQQKDAQRIYAPMTYTFYLKNEPDRRGWKPIYVNLNIGGKRKRIPADIKVPEKYWNCTDMTIEDTEESHDQHLLLKNLEAKITGIRTKHRLAEIPLTMSAFLDQLKTAPSTIDFIEFFKSVKDIQGLKDNTLEKHVSIFAKLKNFKPLLAFQDIDSKFFDQFRTHLRIKHKNASSTINGNISVIKKYLTIAEKYGIKLAVNLDEIAVGDTGGRIVYLQENEVNKLYDYYNTDFIPTNHKLSLGYFLIACYTGLRISDVKARRRQDMLEEFLRIVTFKGKKDVTLFLIPRVHTIVNSNIDLFIEFRSEVTIREHLQKCAQACGIRTRMHFHVGRHTFATNYILKGGRVENLQLLLGHSKIDTTMKYVHIANDVAAKTMMLMQ